MSVPEAVSDDDAFWREAVRWLVRLEMLPSDHRVTWPDARVETLAHTLRDGVVLCNLVLKLRPGSIDQKDMSLRPQMSHFLCNKNIRAFLQALSTYFGITSPNDLFEPEMLFEYTDFKRVLHTLSVLSNSSPATESGVLGFKPPKTVGGSSDYYNQSVFLKEESAPNGISFDHNGDGEATHMAFTFPNVAQPEVSKRGVIVDALYEELCYVSLKIQIKPQVPLEKRDLCIQELLETEKNYIQALQMIRKKFQQPLETVLAREDAELIFKHIRALSEIHTGLLSDLHVANQMPSGRISDCFLRWKNSLILYGDYCSNYPRAQQLLQELQSKNDAVSQAIEKCQRETNDGRYQLNTLLCVPIQRVLKYHLLLRELVKNTLPHHDDYSGLEKALEAMLDLSAYINEVKRDSEMLQIISDIQNSITDYNLPRNTQLRDYGRLLRDGEVKVKSHRDQGVKSRYVFVFDRILLLCKATKGDQYVYKEAISLSSYRVEDYPSSAGGGSSGYGGGVTGAGAVLASSAKSWQHQFLLAHLDQKTAFTITTKTYDDKIKWIEAIQKALDTLDPPAARQTDHERLDIMTFQAPAYCSQCHKLMKGIFFQGYSCSRCNKILHRECISASRLCQTESSSLPSPLPVSRSAPVVGHARALRAYNGGNNADHLSFNVGDVIAITRKLSVVLWEGRIGSRAGFFPAQFVEDLFQPPLDEYPWFAGTMCRERAEAILDSCPEGTYLVRISNKQQLSSSSVVVPHPAHTIAAHSSSLPASLPVYAISLRVGGVVKHMRVYSANISAPSVNSVSCASGLGVSGAGAAASSTASNGSELLYLCKKKQFRTIVDLVTWYQQHSLAESFAGLDETLRTPYRHVVAAARSSGVVGQGPAVISYAIVVHDFEPSQTPGACDQSSRAQFLPLTKGERVAILSKEGDERGWWKGQLHNSFGFFPKTYVQEIQQ